MLWAAAARTESSHTWLLAVTTRMTKDYSHEQGLWHLDPGHPALPLVTLLVAEAGISPVLLSRVVILQGEFQH